MWLIGCEALLVAFRRAHPDDAAFGATVAFLALFWLPARIAVKSEKGSRWELLSAVVAFGWFCLELFLAARRRTASTNPVRPSRGPRVVVMKRSVSDFARPAA